MSKKFALVPIEAKASPQDATIEGKARQMVREVTQLPEETKLNKVVKDLLNVLTSSDKTSINQLRQFNTALNNLQKLAEAVKRHEKFGGDDDDNDKKEMEAKSEPKPEPKNIPAIKVEHELPNAFDFLFSSTPLTEKKEEEGQQVGTPKRKRGNLSPLNHSVDLNENIINSIESKARQVIAAKILDEINSKENVNIKDGQVYWKNDDENSTATLNLRKFLDHATTKGSTNASMNKSMQEKSLKLIRDLKLDRGNIKNPRLASAKKLRSNNNQEGNGLSWLSWKSSS